MADDDVREWRTGDGRDEEAAKIEVDDLTCRLPFERSFLCRHFDCFDDKGSTQEESTICVPYSK